MTGVPDGQPVASGGVSSVAEAAPGIPIGSDGPVFCEPWEAQAFSIVLALQQQGIFTWANGPKRWDARYGTLSSRVIPIPGRTIIGIG